MVTSALAGPMHVSAYNPHDQAFGKIMRFVFSGAFATSCGFIGTIIAGPAATIGIGSALGGGFGLGVLGSIPISYLLGKKMEQWQLNHAKNWELKHANDAPHSQEDIDKREELKAVVNKIWTCLLCVQITSLCAITGVSFEIFLLGAGSMLGVGVGLLTAIPICYFIGKSIQQLQSVKSQNYSMLGFFKSFF